MFGKPSIKYEDNRSGRRVSVTFSKTGVPMTFVSVHFIDDEVPSEANVDERSRQITKAKELLTQAASSC